MSSSEGTASRAATLETSPKETPDFHVALFSPLIFRAATESNSLEFSFSAVYWPRPALSVYISSLFKFSNLLSFYHLANHPRSITVDLNSELDRIHT